MERLAREALRIAAIISLSAADKESLPLAATASAGLEFALRLAPPE
jgi:hypothetical protein